MQVDRPMFILGPPRCGTSLLYRCIGSHPDVGYINHGARKFANHARLGQALTRLGVLEDKPHEARPIWDRFHPGGPDWAGADSVTPDVRAWYHDYIARLLAARRATRFVAKLPAHTLRVPWLDAVFDDALFVQILRDWRAAVASTVVKRRRDAERGKWATNAGWFGLTPPGWEAHVDEPPALGAAWQYRVGHEILEEQRARFGERFVLVGYEELCNAPEPTLARLAEECGLRWDDEVRAALPRDIRPPTDRWRAVLDDATVAAILEQHGDVLARYEFAPA
jgi:hypothetical protein